MVGLEGRRLTLFDVDNRLRNFNILKREKELGRGKEGVVDQFQVQIDGNDPETLAIKRFWAGNSSVSEYVEKHRLVRESGVPTYKKFFAGNGIKSGNVLAMDDLTSNSEGNPQLVISLNELYDFRERLGRRLRVNPELGDVFLTMDIDHLVDSFEEQELCWATERGIELNEDCLFLCVSQDTQSVIVGDLTEVTRNLTLTDENQDASDFFWEGIYDCRGLVERERNFWDKSED